jgi:hypothetical protein
MSDDEYYGSRYDDLAEAWEGPPPKAGGGKKKAKPTTIGRQRQGGTVAVVVQVCRKDCTKKCCTGKRTTPTLKI